MTHHDFCLFENQAPPTPGRELHLFAIEFHSDCRLREPHNRSEDTLLFQNKVWTFGAKIAIVPM